MAKRQAGPTGEHIIYKHGDRSRAQPWYGNINGIYGTLTRDRVSELPTWYYSASLGQPQKRALVTLFCMVRLKRGLRKKLLDLLRLYCMATILTISKKVLS